MISFNKLGEFGRFGNQMFQYAYLRTQAKRLGTKFYCPEWIGDRIFNLNDRDEKGIPFKADHLYLEGDKKHGFNIEATRIKDGTEVVGYFQTDKFFSKEDVLRWFSFNEDMFQRVKEKYKDIDFANSTAIHIRLGDYLSAPLLFYVSKRSYFKKAFSLVSHKKHVLVFSDDPKAAKEHLESIAESALFIEGNKDYEDFYLLSHCKDMICSTSTFCWWAAYLNSHKDKTVITPQFLFLPGAPTMNKDLFEVEGWTSLRAHRFYDNYYIKYIPIKFRDLYNRFLSFKLPS